MLVYILAMELKKVEDRADAYSPGNEHPNERPPEHPAMGLDVIHLPVEKDFLLLRSHCHGWPTFPLMTSMLGNKLMRRIIQPEHKGQFSTR